MTHFAWLHHLHEPLTKKLWIEDEPKMDIINFTNISHEDTQGQT